ncbi:MAG: MFS transporter, partial [Deltaproteobacteria bacterium]|nr:MFS transporter [Deltaproteobacteria bacterium]
PLRAEFGWSKGTVSSAVTLFLLVTAISGSLIGGIVDRYGPSPTLLLGSLCMGLGFVILSGVHELWQLYAVYVLIAIGFSATHSVPISTLISNWFIKKRGIAMSVAMTGLSLGGVIVVPVASYLLHLLGLRGALPFFGIAICVVIVPIALFLVKKSPSVMGLFPDNAPPRHNDGQQTKARPAMSSQMTIWTRRQAMGTKAFWSIVLAFFLVLSGQVTFMIHVVSFLSPTLGPAAAATAVSIMTGTSFCGRLLVGSFVDRVDKRVIAIVCFLIQGGALFTIAQSSPVVTTYLCVIAFGLTMGNIIMLQSLFIGECFGMVSFGRISGLVMLFTSSGSAFGPMIAGILFDVTRSYKAGFTFFALTYAIACGLVLYARPSPQKVASHTPSPKRRAT